MIHRMYPIVLMLSCIGALLVSMLPLFQALRIPVLLWFMLVCPGLAFVQLLRIDQPLIELSLSIALSLAIEMMLALIMLLLGLWHPQQALLALVGITAVGTLIQYYRFNEQIRENSVLRQANSNE